MTRLNELESMYARIGAAIVAERQQLRALAQMRDEVEDLLAQYSASTGATLTAAASAFGVTEGLILGHSREVLAVKARHVAAWLLRDQGVSYPEIGRALGNRDHTTAMNAVRRVENSADLGRIAEQLRDELAAAHRQDQAVAS